MIYTKTYHTFINFLLLGGCVKEISSNYCWFHEYSKILMNLGENFLLNGFGLLIIVEGYVKSRTEENSLFLDLFLLIIGKLFYF
jgi:hypothetical protein